MPTLKLNDMKRLSTICFLLCLLTLGAFNQALAFPDADTFTAPSDVIDSVTVTIHVALVVNQRGATKAARILKTEVAPVSFDEIDEGLMEELVDEAIHDAKRFPGIAPKNKKMAQVVVPIAFVLGAEEALKR